MSDGENHGCGADGVEDDSEVVVRIMVKWNDEF